MESVLNSDNTFTNKDSNIVIEECQELKNIKYKTMLLNGVPLQETKVANDISNLDKFLEEEKNNNNNEPWCKLNKTIKYKKLLEYTEVYKKNKNLNEEETKLLNIFLKDSLDKKKLSRVKDVIYDKDNGIIKEIPALTYIKLTKHFTLKNIDKRVSTLKSLAPKKGHGTIRNKVADHKDSEKDSSEKESSEKDSDNEN
jgi:hypothetical protein